MATVAVLVRLQNNANPDAAKDRRGCYKRGDPVLAKVDDGSWSPGTKEVPPDFAWLWFYGVSLAKVQRFCSEEHETTDGMPAPDSARYRRRLYNVEVDTIPQSVRDIVTRTGRLNVGGAQADVTWAQLRAYIRNRKDGQTEADRGTTVGDLA